MTKKNLTEGMKILSNWFMLKTAQYRKLLKIIELYAWKEWISKYAIYNSIKLFLWDYPGGTVAKTPWSQLQGTSGN